MCPHYRSSVCQHHTRSAAHPFSVFAVASRMFGHAWSWGGNLGGTQPRLQMRVERKGEDRIGACSPFFTRHLFSPSNSPCPSPIPLPAWRAAVSDPRLRHMIGSSGALPLIFSPSARRLSVFPGRISCLLHCSARLKITTRRV